MEDVAVMRGRAQIALAIRQINGPVRRVAPAASIPALVISRPEIAGLPVTANKDTLTPNGHIPAGTAGMLNALTGVCLWSNGVRTYAQVSE